MRIFCTPVGRNFSCPGRVHELIRILRVESPFMKFPKRKHSGRMRTDHPVTWMSSDQVATRPIVDKMTHISENNSLPCGQ